MHRRYIQDLLPALLQTLSDDSDDVVLLNLQVLARICLTESEFQRVLTSIIDLFTADGRLLETRGSLIIRKLCVLLNAKSIYMALAAVLQSKLTFATILQERPAVCEPYGAVTELDTAHSSRAARS
eukprot:18394-Heterococcus_DN1.PRE.1